MSRPYLGHWTSLETASFSVPRSENCFRGILVAFNGSPGSWKALRMAVSLAWQHDAELWPLSIEEGLPRFPATVGEVQEESSQRGILHRDDRALVDGESLRARNLVAEADQCGGGRAPARPQP
ncbi:MAG: universal stress protein [Chloroflexota bacterium]